MGEKAMGERWGQREDQRVLSAGRGGVWAAVRDTGAKKMQPAQHCPQRRPRRTSRKAA